MNKLEETEMKIKHQKIMEDIHKKFDESIKNKQNTCKRCGKITKDISEETSYPLTFNNGKILSNGLCKRCDRVLYDTPNKYVDGLKAINRNHILKIPSAFLGNFGNLKLPKE